MIYDEMAFPSHIGLPWMSGPPTVDGFVEREPGVTTNQLDAGYANGARFIYGGESGIPRAVFQGVKHNGQDFVYMAFAARYDPSFDDNDFVMIVLRPSAGAPASTQDRRIDIKPVLTGAGGAQPNPTDPNDEPDPGDPPGTPLVRTNKPEAVSTFYERNLAGSPTVWNEVARPAGFPPESIRVRSVNAGGTRFWSVEVRIPTTGWITLQPQFGLFFDVGQVFVAGGIEDVVQFPWPFDPDAPLANVLADPFDTLFADWDPTTVGTGFLLAPGATNPAEGVRFKGGANGIGIKVGGNVTSTLDMALGANNLFVAQLQNTHPSTAQDVRARFRIAEFGISGGLYGNQAMWADLPTPPGTNPAPAAGQDIPHTPSPSASTDIELNWPITANDRATFQPLSRHQCIWVQLDSIAPAGGAVAFAQNSVWRNLGIINLSETKEIAVVDGRYFGEPRIDGRHELLLHVTTTRLPPPPKEGASDLEKYYRRYGESKDVPIVEQDPITSGEAATEGDTATATWHAVVHAYERTPETLTFDDGRRDVVIHSGSYGYVARHELQPGEVRELLELSHELVPDGDAQMDDLGDGFYRLSLKPDERVVLVNRLQTIKGDGKDRDETEPGTNGPGGDTEGADERKGCLGMLAAFLAAIAAALNRRKSTR